MKLSKRKLIKTSKNKKANSKLVSLFKPVLVKFFVTSIFCKTQPKPQLVSHHTRPGIKQESAIIGFKSHWPAALQLLNCFVLQIKHNFGSASKVQKTIFRQLARLLLSLIDWSWSSWLSQLWQSSWVEKQRIDVYSANDRRSHMVDTYPFGTTCHASNHSPPKKL